MLECHTNTSFIVSLQLQHFEHRDMVQNDRPETSTNPRQNRTCD